MRTLYHMPLDPFSRTARLILGEKGLEFKLAEERPWLAREELASLNPALEVPVLVDADPAGDEVVICGAAVIAEYLEEVYGGARLLPGTAKARAEARRLSAWFNQKFDRDVNALLLREKVDKRLKGQGPADMDLVRTGYANLAYHMDYVNYLAETRDWLGGERMGLGDITAAAHISCIDYLGDVNWRDFSFAKEWYARIKSRPSFRALLADIAPGFPPPRHYANLDF